MAPMFNYYCSDAAIQEMLDSPVLTEYQKVGLREEQRLRALPSVQELIDELWGGPDGLTLFEADEWDAAEILHRVRQTLMKYDIHGEDR